MRTTVLFCLLLAIAFTQQLDVKLKANRSFGSFTFELHNDEAEIFTFLNYLTPFEGFLADMFEVTSQNGEVMRYMGPIARRVTPPPQDAFISLHPRNTLYVEVNITKFYEITANGVYKISHKVEEFAKFAGNEIELFLRENSENFVFGNTESVAYTNCNSNEISICNSATNTAISQSSQAYNCMGDLNGCCSSRCQTWFGAYSSNNHNYDRTIFINTYNRLRGYGLNGYCNPAGCGSNVYAYVYPTDPSYTVYLCGAFWSVPSERANTVVHEMSHFNAIGNGDGTNDYAYGVSACKNLARNNPTQASHNADNVCYFSDFGIN